MGIDTPAETAIETRKIDRSKRDETTTAQVKLGPAGSFAEWAQWLGRNLQRCMLGVLLGALLLVSAPQASILGATAGNAAPAQSAAVLQSDVKLPPSAIRIFQPDGGGAWSAKVRAPLAELSPALAAKLAAAGKIESVTSGNTTFKAQVRSGEIVLSADPISEADAWSLLGTKFDVKLKGGESHTITIRAENGVTIDFGGRDTMVMTHAPGSSSALGQPR